MLIFPKKKFFLLLVAFSSSAISACGTREMKVPVLPTYSSISSLTIAPKCLHCHSSLASHEGLLRIVKPGNAAKSSLYREIKSGDMPLQSPKLSDSEISAIYTWIQNGAAND